MFSKEVVRQCKLKRPCLHGEALITFLFPDGLQKKNERTRNFELKNIFLIVLPVPLSLAQYNFCY